MVVLRELPKQSIIDGLKGILDFYLWKGIPCCRKWPRKPQMPRTPAVQETAAQFAHIMHVSTILPVFVIKQYRRMAEGTTWRWQDFLVCAYFKGIEY
ncbi:hypothetical protein ES703_37180 [subsurface metagenome]